MAFETTSYTTARREIGRALGIMRYGALTAAAATTVTIPTLWQNTNRAATQAQDETLVMRPDAATAADLERYISSIAPSTGAGTIIGTNYADTTFTGETGEEWQFLRPSTDVLDALNYSLRYTIVRTFYLISNVDGDLNYHCQESAAGDFTSVNSPTVSVVTTARRTQFGRRSVRVLSSGASEGIQTATVQHVQEHNAQAFIFGSTDSGSVTAQLYDVTNSDVIGSDTFTLEEEAEMLVKIPWRAPDTATCKELAIRLIGDDTDTDAYYNGMGIVQQGNRRLYFPSAVSERFKAPALFMAVPQESSTNNGVYPAHSIEWVPLSEGDDFSFMFHHPDANPYGVFLHDDRFLEWPIFVEAQIPASDLGTFSAEADTTVAPANVFIPRAVLRIIDHVILPRFGASERWVALRAIAQKELDDALKVRVTPVVAQRRKPFYGPSGGRI